MIAIIFLFLVLVLGCVLLSEGAVALIKFATTLARIWRIMPSVIGITVVAFGTSIPEFVVSFFAAASGKSDIALGNLIGSNIANIGFIAALCAVFAPLSLGTKELKTELSFMIAAPFILFGLGFDGNISRLDGITLLTIVALFYALLIKKVREGKLRQMIQEAADTALKIARPRARPLFLYIIIGLAGVIIGAYLTVISAVSLARLIGVPEVVIAITLVALGTSLPELATSLIAQFKKAGGLPLANLIGSNVINVFFILGLIAVIAPVSVSSSLVRFDIPVMFLFSLLLFFILLSFGELKRREAAVFLALYAAYVGYSFVK